jgi:serine/threonine protein kinase
MPGSEASGSGEPSMRSNEIHPGDLVAGKYRVRAILGRSHGLLVDAFHTEFEQRVVIKILQPSQCDEREVERFRREARTLAKLETEHVARIIDVGSTPEGSFYLVRQYLEGQDLAAYVKKRGPMPLDEAVLFILQAAEATAETHSHGVIIRELEPSHLFVTQRPGGAPLVKIIDFGTAKLMRDSAAPTAGEQTATAMFGLSPYSSPELMRKAKNVDVRTDVWSLGAIFYELLTGRPPFFGESAMLMLQISKEEPVPVSQYRPDLPPEIDNIIGWCLAKDVDARFRNVHAFAHSLSPYARGEGEVLIQRIGQTTEAAKKRKTAAAQLPTPAPPPAPSRPAGERIPSPTSGAGPHDDSATQLRSPAGFDRMGGFAVPTPGANPTYTERAGDPVSYTRPFPPGASPSSMGGVPAAPPSYAGGAPPGSQQGPGSQGQGPAVSATAQSMTYQGRQSLPPQRSRKLMFGLMAVAAVLVPVAIAVLFLSSGKKETAAETESSGPIAVPTATTAAAESPTPAAADTGAVPAAPTGTSVAAADPPAAEAPAGAPGDPASPAPVAAAGGTTKKYQPTYGGAPAPAPAPAPTPTATAAPASGGGKGTLVAVAMGGSCAFSVNGASKGTSSSLRVALAPGKYSVTCKPATGSAKSKSVVVKSGETAMTTFRL